jgi:eukaryotic-like serine/threonine-protein kinase
MPVSSLDPSAESHNGANSTAQNGAQLSTRSGAVRYFGHLQLLRLLGKSERSMAWWVEDSRTQQELMLVLPRVQPADAAALMRWQHHMRRATRLSHPHLAAAVEVGVQEGWPFATYDVAGATCVADRVTAQGIPGPEAAAWFSQALTGLAFAQDAGVAHHDLQAYMLWVNDSGKLHVAGLAVAVETAAPPAHIEPLRVHRAAAERDVLSAGILLHGVLAGKPALDEPDVGRVVACLPPHCGAVGRDIVRLPWAEIQLLAEPLRAIVNRATDRQERQRYRSARTFLAALEGWQKTHEGEGGPLALLAERLRAAGVLPAAPGAAQRAARLATMDRERTIELADVVLQDLALSFEMLRLVNSAHVRGAQVSGTGPVLTVRRAIAMLGMDGVRHAAHALREWPGPLNDEHAAELQRLTERCKRAARVAVALRPAGYDGEVTYLICLLQNLGRLIVQYHFPEEAAQIYRLMQAVPAARVGEPDEPGLSEEIAAYAVLGADIEAIGIAVARYWGLEDEVLGMIRRVPLTVGAHHPDTDDDVLRTTASCANEAVDAMALPATRVGAALQRVVQRYGRPLGFGTRHLQNALQRSASNGQLSLTELDDDIDAPSATTSTTVHSQFA